MTFFFFLIFEIENFKPIISKRTDMSVENPIFSQSRDDFIGVFSPKNIGFEEEKKNLRYPKYRPTHVATTISFYTPLYIFIYSQLAI